MIDNIFKHFKAPAGVDQSEWEESIKSCITAQAGRNRDPSAWAYWMTESGEVDASDVSSAIEDLCDRYQKLLENQ